MKAGDKVVNSCTIPCGRKPVPKDTKGVVLHTRDFFGIKECSVRFGSRAMWVPENLLEER